MKKKAKELKKGDRIVFAGKKCTVEEIEVSDIAKQGTKKVRIVVKMENGDSMAIVRPEDYPIEKE